MPSTKRKTAPSAKKDESAKKHDKVAQIKQSCPIKWNGSDGGNGLVQSMGEEADLCLSVGWENDPGEEGLMEKCLEYINPLKKGQYARVDEETFDHKAAEKALRKDGSIDDIYEFSPKGGDGCWLVHSQCKKTLTKEEASSSLEDLFGGSFCSYPEVYDNFGKTPFSGQSGSEASGSESKGDEKQTRLSHLKESVSIILDRASFVAHSYWEGHCEDFGGDGDSQIERQDFFFFCTEDDQKFLLQFKWSYVCG